MGAFYNAVAFLSAFVLAYLARKYGPKYLHGLCLLAGVLLVLAAFSVLFIKIKKSTVADEPGFVGGGGH